MQRDFSLTLIAVLGVWAGATAFAEPLNILWFGNSFTDRELVNGKVIRLAEFDGKPRPMIVTDIQGGAFLQRHWDSIEKRPETNVDHPAIHDKTWDFVVIQGHSREATTRSGNPEKMSRDARKIYRLVRDHPSGWGQGVAPVLYQTWARGPGHNFYPEKYPEPRAMQDQVTAGYSAAWDDFKQQEPDADVRLAPTGETFASLNFDSRLYGSDIYHQSYDGALLSAMVLYRAIYDEDVSDIAYATVADWTRVDEAWWNRLVEAADAVTINRPDPGWPTLAEIASRAEADAEVGTELKAEDDSTASPEMQPQPAAAE